MNMIVRYTEPVKEEAGETILPYSVSVSGDMVATSLPRDHPDWIAWGIDQLELRGEILPFETIEEIPLTEEEIIARNREHAKVTRDLSIEAPIIVHGVSFQVDVAKDEPRINRAIRAMERENVGSDYTTDWTLTDNTARPSTLEDLKKVLHEKSLRERQIFTAYQEWRRGDMKTPFTVPITRGL